MPEHVINYLMLVAEEVRTLMARMGFRSLDYMIGAAGEVLRADPSGAQTMGLQFNAILEPAHRLPDAGKIGKGIERRKLYGQDHFPVLGNLLDRKLVRNAQHTFRYGKKVYIEYPGVTNMDRTVGTVLS